MPGKIKDLEKIENIKISNRYLQYATELSEVASCYIEKLNLRFEALIQNFLPDVNELHLEIEDSFYRKMNNFELIELGKSKTQTRISFSVGDVLFFLGAKIIKRSGRNIYVEVEYPIYKLQRRNALRIKAAESHQAKIKIENYDFEVHDISASGMSIIVSQDLAIHFPKGRKIKNVGLHFIDSPFLVSIEVTSMCRPQKDPKKNWKIGFKFVEIPTAAEQAIAKEAYLYTHKIWSRWI